MTDPRRVSTALTYAVAQGGPRVSTALIYVVHGENHRRVSTVLAYAVCEAGPEPQPPGTPTLTERESAAPDTAKLLLTGGSGADSHELLRDDVVIDTLGALETPLEYDDTGLAEVTCYTYVLRAINTEGSTDSPPLTVCTPGYGTPPILVVGSLTESAATLLVTEEVPSPYLELRYQVTLASDPDFQTPFVNVLKVGDGRFEHGIEGLTPGESYLARAQGTVAEGLTDWSVTAPFTATPPEPPGIGLETQDPVGFFDPLPGEPVAGERLVRWRTLSSSQTWDLYLRSDEEAAWGAAIAEGVGGPGVEDRDGYTVYQAVVDFSALADGAGYQLRAVAVTGPEEEVVHFAFTVDNTGTIAYYWAPKKFIDPEQGSATELVAADPLTDPDNYGLLWNAAAPWVYGWAGSQATISVHDPSILVHRGVPLTRGADIISRINLWSSEGGFGWWRNTPTHALHIGHVLMAAGTGAQSDWEGLAIGVSNWQTWPLGPCDDYLTSTSARLFVLHKRLGTGYGFFGNVAEQSLPKLYWKATNRPYLISGGEVSPCGFYELNQFRSAAGCCRRYPILTLRSRVDVDPEDDTRARVRVAIRGPGLDPDPDPYWQIDDDFEFAAPLKCGLCGPFAYKAPGDPQGDQGAREFFSFAVASTEQDCESVPDPDPVPPPEPPQPVGAPCTLILTKYADDRETVDWIVSDGEILPTFTGEEVLPLLCTPEHYGEQEIDVATGAATITQVEVAIVDPRQIPGDQDSGWMTERLSRDGMGDIHGSRFQLVRFISEALGRVVIVDGPAGVPRMDDTYAAFKAVLRDTRETERKIRAFSRGGTTTLLPMGVLGGYGFEDGEWLVDPTEPLLGRFNLGFPETPGPTTGIVNLQNTPGNDEALRLLTMDAYAALQGEVEFGESIDAGDRIEHHYRTHFTHLKVMWRAQGSEDDWSEIPSPHLVIDGIAEEVGGAIAPANDRLVLSQPWPDFETQTHRVATSLFIGDARVGPPGPFGADPQPGASLPEHDQDIELVVVYIGPPTPKRPFHIEGLTLGEFVRNAYDGVYSPRDPVTGDIVPTGIRYNAADVLAMTEPVRARITEPVKDLRDWLEKHGYAPAGWVPALNHDADISPIYQAPPEDMSEAANIDNAITEPAPSWDAGERVINVIAYRYPRHYIPAVADEDAPADGIFEREVEVEFRDEASITRHGEEVQEYDAKLFAAVGTEDGASLLGVQDETGHQQAQLKRLYVFDRYRNGAQGFRVAVMREHTWMLRAGSWVMCDLSWFPDYTTQRRGMITAGQIVAIRDLDCAWREILFEEALFVSVPPVEPEES